MEAYAGLVVGRYLLRRQLGQGGMGSVWEAEHTALRAAVAVKLIDPAIAGSPDALSRFMREAQASASLRSPHVVQILDYGVDQGRPYIAMELLDGESLAQRLARVSRLSPRETALILTHVARAISKAHEAGIVHRDLKPDNIFIVQNDDEEVAKVLDFGVAKAIGMGLGSSAGSGTRTGALLGTPYYMSPEQAEGTKAVDHRTDIWAMAVIAFECLTGRRPFESEALGGLLLSICTRPLPIPSQYGPVPPGFDAWFAVGAARSLSERFHSAKQAASELRTVCGIRDEAAASAAHSASVPARSAVPLQPLKVMSTTAGVSSLVQSSAIKPRRGVVALVSALVVLAVIGVGAFFMIRKLGGGVPTPEASAAVLGSQAAPSEAEPAAPTTNPVNSVSSAVATASAAPEASVEPATDPQKPVRAARPTGRPSSKKPEKPTEPAPRPAEKPATAEPKVNLGI
jgi:serine/threonine protein kinase